MNHQISVLSSNGILSHLVNKYADQAFLNIKQIEVKPTPINFTQVSGIFYLCMGNLAISFVVFSIEIGLLKVKRSMLMNLSQP